jgi:hypothetical protein
MRHKATTDTTEYDVATGNIRKVDEAHPEILDREKIAPLDEFTVSE